MKKVLTTIGLAGLVALSSYGQGLVVFTSSTQNISTNSVAGGAATGKTSGAGDYYYALFDSASSITSGVVTGNTNLSLYAFNIGAWTLDSDPTAAAASTGTAGRFGSTSPNADGSTTVPGIAGGANAWFVVVGWSANLGTNISQLETSLADGVSGWIGQSVTSGALALGNGALDPTPSLFSSGAPGIPAFTLGATTVPEPATMALAALGGASLLMFRRKNKK